MAGLGKRMRPHTLTVPKPLIPVAGKPIVQRLVEDITRVMGETVDEIAFVVSPNLQAGVLDQLREIAIANGARGTIYTQDEPLGTAHAVYCAAPSIDGKVVVAFADTLFKASFVLDEEAESIIWVSQVSDPSAFGVVCLDEEGCIAQFVEKPKTFVSDLAIIGIYYFRDGIRFKNELKWLMDNDQRVNGEYQLTDALENMKKSGIRFKTSRVDEWLDCGNKDSTVYTNQRILADLEGETLVHPSASLGNSVIVPPCYVGQNVEISDSVIGPFVSIGENSRISHSLIENSIIQNDALIEYQNIRNSMIGNSVDFKGTPMEVNFGDFGSFGSSKA